MVRWRLCLVLALLLLLPARSRSKLEDDEEDEVHTITCHSVDDKCFTTIMSKGNTYEAVVRGCRSGCIGTPDTTCCELNRCNNQALALPVAIAPRAKKDKASKSFPPTVFFFVTVLLLLQTAAKVAFI
ncbi:unnamed protein product [Parnassius apollo]|uniref:(apollo) hypothetical protein n=1 Tax=Parnassius apollo TaxID=110799 RepID=A0A8S3X2P8_PARAO|nr:unnamed protein product [Parnassius apollo]